MNWAPIKDFENYSVSDTGLVRNSKGKILKYFRHSSGSGYLNVSLSRNGIHYSKSIHSLVMIAFGPEKPISNEKIEIDHLDGNKQNNSIDNLKWKTHRDNVVDAYAMGLYKTYQGSPGSKHYRSLLIESDVIKIRKYYSSAVRFNKFNSKIAIDTLSVRYKVSVEAIRSIVYRKTWRHI